MEPLILRAVRNEPVPRPPVWLMRQAGRYLAEYREIKSRHTFLEMCTTPDLAVEVTLQPLRIFPVDAAIVFADILLPLQALGMKVDFNPGPKVFDPIKSRADVEALKLGDPSLVLGYLMEALRRLRSELAAPAAGGERRALIGFAGAPWTMACYMIDQGPWKHFAGTQIFANENPEAMHLLLDKLAELTADYLVAQLESGADLVQLFDSWGGLLSIEDYRRFSLPSIQKIIHRVRKSGRPIVLYVNGSAHLFDAMCESGADCLGVDWRTALGEAQKKFKGALQGNLDPAQLFGPRTEVSLRTKAMLGTLERPTGYVANLGHGILQQTPRENVAAFVETVQNWKGE